MKKVIIIALSLFSIALSAQNSTNKDLKLKFLGDFRFRVEYDWNALNSSGQAIDDRSRLRYRFRFGLNYSINTHSSLGARIRSGNINDQQGPHVTIGGGEGEFGLTKIGFERAYYQYKNEKLIAWIGKNDLPIFKLNELFWNDNVFAEGVALKYKSLLNKEKSINQIGINTGHFIINSNNLSFSQDSYLQVLQFYFVGLNEKLKFFPALYRFKRIGNFPDGMQAYNLDYSILHFGLEFKFNTKFKLGAEIYSNLENYESNEFIIPELLDQKKGMVISAKYGDVKKKGHWLCHLYYANIQKFAIVDYFAQNDWVRWDYSSVDASGSRISNFHGVELKVGYAISEEMNLSFRTYFVEQLVAIGSVKEKGNRVRLDFNVAF